MAIACLRLFTFLPPRPLRGVPLLRLRMAPPTTLRDGLGNIFVPAKPLLLALCFLDEFPRLLWTAPSAKLQTFGFERVRRPKERLQLADRPSRHSADVLQMALERGAVRDDEQPVVALLFGANHGGDSGIGRSVATLFAREGADVAVAYLKEYGDADKTKAAVEKEGRRCIKILGDVADPALCAAAGDRTLKEPRTARYPGQ
jgi:hypothetical protein